MQCITGQPVSLPFYSTSGTVLVIKDGALSNVSPVITIIDAGSNLRNISFVPNSPGNWFVFAESRIQHILEVVDTSFESFLKDIHDEALGSWEWNKTTGILTLYGVSGDELSSFNVVDTEPTSSRERIVPSLS